MFVFDYRLIALFDLFFFLNMTKIKAIREEIQNNTKAWINPI